MLSHGISLLQRDVHHREFGCEQLRRLRKRLPRSDADLHSGRLRRESVWPRSDVLLLRLHQP
jgi:hypothetical protein